MGGGKFNDWERRLFAMMFLRRFTIEEIAAILEDTPPEVDVAWEPILRNHLARYYGGSDSLPFPAAFTRAVKTRSPRGGVYDLLLASQSVRHAGLDAEAFAAHAAFFDFIVTNEDLHEEGEFLTYVSVEITEGVDANMDSSSLDEEVYISFAVAASRIGDLAGDAPDYEPRLPPRFRSRQSAPIPVTKPAD